MNDRILPITPSMTYGQMRLAVSQNTDIWVYSRHLPDPRMGCYDEDTQTIAIDIDLKYVQKRCTLVHELMHWKHGDQSCPGVASSKIERRARKDTALYLIDPMEYATLEGMYEGNKYKIASELNLTVQVVEDYMQMLHDFG